MVNVFMNVEDEVCTFPAFEEDLVRAFQPLGHVVGIKNSHLCRVKQSYGSHHLNNVRSQRLEVKHKHELSFRVKCLEV